MILQTAQFKITQMDDIILKGFGREEFNLIFFLLCRRKHFIDLV